MSRKPTKVKPPRGVRLSETGAVHMTGKRVTRGAEMPADDLRKPRVTKAQFLAFCTVNAKTRGMDEEVLRLVLDDSKAYKAFDRYFYNPVPSRLSDLSSALDVLSARQEARGMPPLWLPEEPAAEGSD